MSNITITNKGSHFTSSCGAWSVDGISWFGDTGISVHYPDHSLRSLRTAFKQQILDGEPAPKTEPEPEVFTGDPIENEWGDGFYESAYEGCDVYVACCGDKAVRIDSDGYVDGEPQLEGLEFTRISRNPADLIAERWKAVE